MNEAPQTKGGFLLFGTIATIDPTENTMNVEQLSALIAQSVAAALGQATAAPAPAPLEVTPEVKAQQEARNKSVQADAKALGKKLHTLLGDFDPLTATGLIRSLADRARYDHFLNRFWLESTEMSLLREQDRRSPEGIIEYGLDKLRQLGERANANAMKMEQSEVMLYATAYAFSEFEKAAMRGAEDQESQELQLMANNAPNTNISEKAYVEWSEQYERKRAAKNPRPSLTDVRQTQHLLRSTERAWSPRKAS